jgi:hypothetical protein
MKLTALCSAAALALMPAPARAGADAGEFLLDPEAVYTTAPSHQRAPAIASDGTNSLVVWSDARSGLSDIYGARFTPEGIVLDPAGIAISAATDVQTNPAVACDGTDYLVVWSDQRSDTSDVYAARVTADGRVLDGAGIPVSTAAGFQGEPAVTFDGTSYLVVWTDLRDGEADIYGARVTRNGVLIDTSGLAIVADSAWQTGPAAVYDGTNVLLVWEDNRDDLSGDIYGARITPEGTVLDSSGFAISSAQNWQASPAVAVGDADVLVVWHDARASAFTDVYGARVSNAGEVLDPNGIGISTMDNYQWFPKVAFDDTNYLVVWVDEHGHGLIYGGRVAADGSVLDPEGFPIGGAEDMSSPAVAFDGTYNAVVWNDVRTGPADLNVYGTRVDGSGVVLDPQGIAVSTAATPQERPAAAFDGTEFLVVWDEASGFGRDIHGVRLTPGGTVLDSPSIRISPAGGNRAYPAVGYGTSDFLAVWEDGLSRERDVSGARVSPNGEVLDSAGILISGAPWEQCAAAVASDGTDFLVAWQDWRNSNYDIYCARVSGTGAVLDTSGVTVCLTTGDQLTPALAYNGTNYLVLWQDQGTGTRDVYGARVSSQGVVLDPDGFVVSAAPGTQQRPAATSDGDNFLVVWSDSRNAAYNVYAARVTAAGTVLDTAGILLFPAAGPQTTPSVEYDSTNFLVVWQDERNGEQDIYGARVTPEGTILDTFAVITQQGYQVNPVLASNGGNKTLLAYSGWTGVVAEKPYNSPRIWGTLSPAGGTSDRPAEAAYLPRPATSVVRGVLFLPSSLPSAPFSLLSVDGRKVMSLKPGSNDISRLSPGVYFIEQHSESGSKRWVRTSKRKVIKVQ